MFHLMRHVRKALQPLAKSALDLEASERRAWLQELRTDCPTVARELERLLEPGRATVECDDNRPACTVVPGSPEHLGLRC